MVVIDREGDVVKEVQGLGTSDNRKDWKETLMSFVLEAPVIMALKSWRGQESSSSPVINKQSSTQKDLVDPIDQLTGSKRIFLFTGSSVRSREGGKILNHDRSCSTILS